MFRKKAKAVKEQSIYKRYGGYEFFHGCIYELYKDMFLRPEISHHFLGVDIDILSRHQTQYLVKHIGGPHRYGGKPIKWVHRNMDITDFQFDEIAKAFKQVFLDRGVSEEDTQTIMNFVASRKGSIVTASWSLIDGIMMPIYYISDLIRAAFNIILGRK